MTIECVHNNNIAIFCGITMWSGKWPGARGLGPGLGLKYENYVAGRAWIYFLRAGSGPGLIIQFAGRARAGSAQLLRARAGPWPQIIFAGRAWA